MDASCSSTFREGEERQLRRSAAGVSASEQDKRDVQDHQLQYDAILGLGNPPAAVGLYRSWLSNMHRRIVIEKEALSDMLAGHRRQGTRLLAEMDYLKVEGDSLGQQFGLRICTSNGPLRSTVPDRAAQQSL